MLNVFLSFEIISMGFDTPENQKAYKEVVDSLVKRGGGGSVVVVGEGDSVFLYGEPVGLSPTLVKPDTSPVEITVKGEKTLRFSIDLDSSTVVVIYASERAKAAKQKQRQKLPPYEETEEGFLFNIHGKRVLVLNSLKRGYSTVFVKVTPEVIAYNWKTIDTLVRITEGKTLIFINAQKAFVDGRNYGYGTVAVQKIPPGEHHVRARGVHAKVNAYLNLKDVDVVVVIMDTYEFIGGHTYGEAEDWEQREEAQEMQRHEGTSQTYTYHNFYRFVGGALGGAMGGLTGFCLGVAQGDPQMACFGCVLGTVVGATIGSAMCSL